MNRTIKFRAWHEGKMIYEKDIQHIAMEDNLILRLAKFWCNVMNDSIIMQFTGLFDKNGKEIFEGDIIEFEYQNGGGFTRVKEPVIFYRGQFDVMGGDSLKEYAERSEIIGNIHQNPAMIEILNK